jgi:phosphomannomutase
MTEFNWFQLQNGSDIRGVALEGIKGEEVNLTPAIARAIGQSFVLWLSDRVNKSAEQLIIGLGRDSRLSGQALLDAVAEGMTTLGTSVYDFGIASTPAMFMSTITPGFDCDGAIMLTASHLPFNRNGLKFFTKDGGLDKPDIKAILTTAAAEQAPEPAAQPGTIAQKDFMGVYAAQLVDVVRTGVNHPDRYERPLEGLNIIVDAGNGAGGFYCDRVLKPLGADVTGSQFLEPDGTFPNHIPNPENDEAMASICEAVTKQQADFGIIFDTDVDRAGAVDNQGQPINRNRLIALIAAVVLEEHPGSAIVTDSITSDGLATFITATLGGVHHRFKRGYKNVINEAVRLNESGQESWLAIETSGHGAMKENHFLDDGAYLVTKLLVKLAQLRSEGKKLTDLIADLPEPVESEEFRIKIKDPDFKTYGESIITALETYAQQQSGWSIVPNNYEGIRIACAAQQGWFLLRLSLHDPVIPLNIEANVPGGVAAIATPLKEFFGQFEELDLSVFG